MTGALAAVVCNGGLTGGGGGGIVAASPVVWNDIYGEDSGSTQTLTINGITTPIQIVAARTGSGVLSYILNGVFLAYTGAFKVQPGDGLAWAVAITGVSDRAGVVTVTNATTSTILDSFNYTVYSSQGGRM